MSPRRKQGLPVELCARGAVAWDLQGHPLSSQQPWKKHSPGVFVLWTKRSPAPSGDKADHTLLLVPDDQGRHKCPKGGSDGLQQSQWEGSSTGPTLTVRKSSFLGPGGLWTPDHGTPSATVSQAAWSDGCRVRPHATDWAVPMLRRHQAGAVRPLLISAHPLLHLSLYPWLPGPLVGTTRWGPVYRWVCVVSGTSQRNDLPGNCQLPGGRLVTLGPSHHGGDGQRCVLSRRTLCHQALLCHGFSKCLTHQQDLWDGSFHVST